MRFYNNFIEAKSEIKRDLGEMGIDLQSYSHQGKLVKDDTDFKAKELQNYIYTVTGPNLSDLNPTQPWADAEFAERVRGWDGVTNKQIAEGKVNPGEAYKLRPEVWEPLLNKRTGQFDYTYGERLGNFRQLEWIIRVLNESPNSRQAFLAVWASQDLHGSGGKYRIPCSIGYYFQVRQGKLIMTYLQRSGDFVTHFENDMWMAHSLQRYILSKIENEAVEIGPYTHWVGSLHVFKKDIEGVF